MASPNEVNDEMLVELKEILNRDISGNFVNCPDYVRKNKHLASLYMEQEEEHNAIFYLTESHAATLRQRAIYTFYSNKSKNKSHDAKFSGSLLSELQIDHLSFDNNYYRQGFAGLVERLNEMPQEWTIVQLTFEFDKNESFFGLFKNAPQDLLKLHVSRLPCGGLVGGRTPCTVLVEPPPDGRSDGLSSILDVITASIKKITLPGTKQQKFKIRQEASNDMKIVISREILSTWLKQWCCLMIGSLNDRSLQGLIKTTVDSLLSMFSEKERSEISISKLSILYQIVDGCAHLSEEEILKAVKYCFSNNDHIHAAIVSGICQFKEDHSHTLIKAKRNPVLLILDDRLDSIPWEMLPVLFRHPVSRIPSIHFAHALYNKHKDDIINGNRIVENTDVAFYIINPERDLEITEKNLLKFIQQRHPNWNGIKGEKPTGDLFLKSLLDYNVFVYSGHGNGAQYLNPAQLCELNVDAVPLLFGCSSASKKVIGEGGRNEMMGVSDQFLIAGCPCLVGMLWPVTTTDTDLVTMMLLNMTMSGNPININDVIGSEEIESSEVIGKEPELLRALKSARCAAKLFTNGAALVARGIPIEFRD